MSLLSAIADHYVASSPPGATHPDVVIAKGASALWRLGEASGATTAVDAINGHNGTYTNTPTLGVAGLLTGDTDTAMGVAVDTGQCMSVPSATWMDQSAFSVEVIYKQPSNWDSTNGDAIVGRYISGTGLCWLLYSSGDGHFSFQVVDNTGTAHTATAAGFNDYGFKTHIVGTFDGSAVKVYVNGALAGSASSANAVNASTSPIEVGRYSAANNTTPTATIDEVAFYPTALSAADVTVLSNSIGTVFPWSNMVAVNTTGATSITVDPSNPTAIGTLIGGAAFTPTSGRKLIVAHISPYTVTTPSGWTAPANSSAVNSNGTYVFTKTAAGSDTAVLAHSSSTYPSFCLMFEFPSTSTIGAMGSATSATGKTLSGMSGTNTILTILSATNSQGAQAQFGTSVTALDWINTPRCLLGYVSGYASSSLAETFGLSVDGVIMVPIAA